VFGKDQLVFEAPCGLGANPRAGSRTARASATATTAAPGCGGAAGQDHSGASADRGEKL